MPCVGFELRMQKKTGVLRDKKVSHMKKQKSPLIAVGTRLEDDRQEDSQQQSKSAWQ